MKKVITLVIMVAILVTYFEYSGMEAEQNTNDRKQNIEEFKIILTDYIRKQNIAQASVMMDAFKEVTPEEVFEEIGCQIFKNGKTCEAYLMYEGSIYTLGIGFGGFGIVDIVTCDYDNNGKKDLLYTYSFGSGIHRSCIGYFDIVNKCEKEIEMASGQSLGLIQNDLALKKISSDLVGVYTATVKINGDFTKLSLEKDKLFGLIRGVENKPLLFK